VLKLVARFVPAADEVHRLQMGADPECKLFQTVCEQGHYGGRAKTSTRQGTYAAAPSGVMLASINSNDPVQVARMLQRALARWETLTRAERLLPEDPDKQSAAVKRPERLYPRDGLVLRVYSRDMPRETLLSGWRGKAWNQDFAWFTSKEVKQFLPAQLQVGQKQEVPAPVIRRMACVHLVDNVRGQTTPFEEQHIKKARLTAEVAAVNGDVVALCLEGETQAAEDKKRSFETRLLGKATYDLKKERFLTFELVAVGTRSGGTQFNFRRDDLAPAPMGILFTLAGDGPGERVAPAFYYHRSYRAVLAEPN
jgi:hypothetical protein